MKKHFRTVKTGIIFGILLCSLFAIFVPTSSAGPLKVPTLILVQQVTEGKQNIVPNSGVLEIPLITTFQLYGPFASLLRAFSLLKETAIKITLTVDYTPDYCEAVIINPQVELSMDPSTEPRQSRLSLTITEQAPAFTQGKVRIKAISEEQPSLLFSIKEGEFVSEVPFEIGYWPVISHDEPRGNLMEIGPLETADFPITIENLGNGPTYVAIELIDIPKGDWSVNIADSVQLGSAITGVGTSKTVHLIVKPPYGFGIHNERQNFKVKLTPSYLGSPDLVGQEMTLTFNVQNVGFSPGIGYEIPSIIAVFVVIGLVIYLFRRRKL